jgi:hypothetical protein
MENVAKWSDWYHLADHMRCHAASRPVLMHNTNTKAQLLHAYIGATFEEDRIAGVEEWIRTLINFQNNQEEEARVSSTIDGLGEYVLRYFLDRWMLMIQTVNLMVRLALPARP